MKNFLVVHSTKSGKDGPEAGLNKMQEFLKAAIDKGKEETGKFMKSVSSKEEITATIKEMISSNVQRVAINGGDGFSALFFDRFFKIRSSMSREDYNPDVLFLGGGTGNAISYCSNFKNPVEALRALFNGEYATEPLNFMEVDLAGKKEISHFVSFGADGEIISIYENQKQKGLFGYIIAVLKYSFSRKLYNPFSRNDANYNLEIEKDGEQIHSGRHEGGGISAIQYIGYGFRPYPLATEGKAHIRFVLFGAWLMPTLFKFTKWVFTKRPNKIIYDHEVDKPCKLGFSFDRPLHIQISGDLREKLSKVAVNFSMDKTVRLVKKAPA